MVVRGFEIEVPLLFRLELTVWALRRRPHNAVDRWDGMCYRRTLLCVSGRSRSASTNKKARRRLCWQWSFEAPPPRSATTQSSKPAESSSAPSGSESTSAGSTGW